MKNVSSFEDLENLFLKKQSEHPELYPTWKALLSDQTLFNQSKNGQFAENEIIINCSKYVYEKHNFVSDDKELTKLMVDKLRAMYTARNVMNDIYRYGGTINTFGPKHRFIIENTDLADNNRRGYIQSLKDPSRKIPVVDQMARDYKKSRSFFEELWRYKLFEEKQIVRNALCKEYELDEKDKNNDIVIKFNEFNGETAYNEGFALVNGKLTYFKKLQNDKLPYIFIECKSRKIVTIERQLEDFIKDCDGYLRLKNYHYYSTKENPKFTNYEDILCDGDYSKDLLSRPLTKAQLEKILSAIEFEKNKKQKTVTAPANNSIRGDSTRKYTLEDHKCENAGNVYVKNTSLYGTYGTLNMAGNPGGKFTFEDDKRTYNSMWDSVFGDNAYTIISNIWDNFNDIDGNVYANNMNLSGFSRRMTSIGNGSQQASTWQIENQTINTPVVPANSNMLDIFGSVYVNNMSIPSSLRRITSIGNGSQQASTWRIGSQTINTPAVPVANGADIPNNNSSEKTKLEALKASIKELDERENERKKNDSEISLD